MNHLQHFNEIEILFENCDCLRVETAAIREFYFHSAGRRYRFADGRMDYTTEVDEFILELDLSRPEWYVAYASQKGLIEDPVKRLSSCTDITRFYINGECFSVPWGNLEFSNPMQKNELTTDKDGHEHLRITIEQK
jgi:hypothetical protein